MGTKDVAFGASLIGLAEIENEAVIKDLIKTDSLARREIRWLYSTNFCGRELPKWL